MIYSYPDYYKKFRCIADKCPDTCCSDWQIVIDDESLEKYRNYAGEYRQTLHRNIQWEEGVFGHNRKGKCAFLRDDGLCDMYKHMGKDSLLIEAIRTETKNDSILKVFKERYTNIEVVRGGPVAIDCISMQDR